MLRALAAALLALALHPAAAPARQFMVVGVEDVKYFPHYDNDKGDYIGLGRDILDAFADARGYQFVYQVAPVVRLYAQMFTHQALDFKYPDDPGWNPPVKAGLDVAYSDPVAQYTDGALVKPERVGLGLAQLTRLGTLEGFTPVGYQEEVGSGRVSLMESPSIVPLLRQALAGRIDATYVNVDVGLHHLKEHLRQPGGLVFDPALPHVMGHYRLSTLKRKEVLLEFNAWLKDSGAQLAEIKRKYGMEP